MVIVSGVSLSERFYLVPRLSGPGLSCSFWVGKPGRMLHVPPLMSYWMQGIGVMNACRCKTKLQRTHKAMY